MRLHNESCHPGSEISGYRSPCALYRLFLFLFFFFFCPNHSLCNDVSSDSRGPPMVILPLTVIFTNTAFLPFCSYKAIPNALISGSSRNANLTSSSPTANRILLGRSAL